MHKIEFSNLVNKLVEQSGLNKTELAEKASLSRTSFYKLLKGDIAEAKLSTLINVSNALGVPPLELLRPYLKHLSSTSSLGASALDLDTGFISDVTYPDNAIVYTGQLFDKIWSVKNQGTKPWKGLYLECQDKPHQLNGLSISLNPVIQKIAIPEVLPGEKALISVSFKAPELPTTVISSWKATYEDGTLVFPNKKPLYCMVKVISL